MGVTGVRAVAEANGIDLAWSRSFTASIYPGPRLRCAAAGLRATGAFMPTLSPLKGPLVP